MTNDLTSITGCMQEAIDKLEENLALMGVTASYNSVDGYYDLLDEILNITGSVGGIILNTSLSLSANTNHIPVSQSITLSGKLECSYDDISVSNEDMVGYIQHASIELYNGNTLITTVITDNNGEFTYNYTPNNTGEIVIKAVYNGSDFYESCYSNNVNVSVENSFTLTSNKNILSHADNEYATLTATLTANNIKPVSFIAYKTDNSLFSKLEFDSSTNEEYDNEVVSKIEGDKIKIDFSNISDYAALILQSKDNNILLFEYSNNNIDINESLGDPNTEEYYNIEGNIATIDLNNNLLNDEYELRDEYNILYSPYIESTGDNLVIKSNAELIDTVNTNASGVATTSYHGKGTGDIYVKAICSNITSNTVNIEDCYWIPRLDGTESKRQITGSTTISDGVMSGGSSYLTQHYIDNTKDWEVTLNGKISGSTGGIVFVKAGTTQRDKDRFMFVRVENTSRNYAGWLCAQTGQSVLKDNLLIPYPSENTFASFIFRKQGDTYTVTIDDTHTMSITSTNFSNVTELGIGVDTWGSTASIKDIKVKYI